MKLELLTNATVVDDAIKFVTGHGKPIVTLSSDERTRSAAIREKTNTAEGIQGLESAHYSPSTTTNQTF
jgi:hypothetical protein